MDENQTQDVGRGGLRVGAGRPSLLKRGLQKANGLRCDPLYADVILSQVIDERRCWQRVFNSPDDRIVLQGLMFLVSMRDGKPAQRINVTSTNVNINAGDVERARAIAAEFRQAFSPTEEVANGAHPSLCLPGAPATSIMVEGDEGDKKDGVDGNGE